MTCDYKNAPHCSTHIHHRLLRSTILVWLRQRSTLNIYIYIYIYIICKMHNAHHPRSLVDGGCRTTLDKCTCFSSHSLIKTQKRSCQPRTPCQSLQLRHHASRRKQVLSTIIKNEGPTESRRKSRKKNGLTVGLFAWQRMEKLRHERKTRRRLFEEQIRRDMFEEQERKTCRRLVKDQSSPKCRREWWTFRRRCCKNQDK